METVLTFFIVVTFFVALAWAAVELLASERPVLHKLAWFAVILAFPVFGVVVYFATADREL